MPENKFKKPVKVFNVKEPSPNFPVIEPNDSIAGSTHDAIPIIIITNKTMINLKLTESIFSDLFPENFSMIIRIKVSRRGAITVGREGGLKYGENIAQKI